MIRSLVYEVLAQANRTMTYTQIAELIDADVTPVEVMRLVVGDPQIFNRGHHYWIAPDVRATILGDRWAAKVRQAQETAEAENVSLASLMLEV